MIRGNNCRRGRAPATALFLSLAVVGGSAADATGFMLTIRNGDTQPITVTLSDQNNNCYESDETQLGQTWEGIPPGGTQTFKFWRRGGHGCDGISGEFDLLFNPAAGVKNASHIAFSNDGTMFVDRGKPNNYPGQLTKTGGASGWSYYTYVTPLLHPGIQAGVSQGRWELVCQNICNREHIESVATTDSTSKTLSHEQSTAVITSLESGLEVEGVGGVKSSISVETRRSLGQQVVTSFQKGVTSSDADRYSFTPEQMRDLNIFGVWQWVAVTPLSDKTTVTTRSAMFTCTRDGSPPRYTPGAPEDITACRGSSNMR